MDQIPKSANNPKGGKSSFSVPPSSPVSAAPFVSSFSKSVTPPVKYVSSASSATQPNISQTKPIAAASEPVTQIPPILDKSHKSQANVNTLQTGQQFKLASAEVQGPKPPLVSGGGSKFSLIAIAAILIIIAGIGGYYFYTNDNSLQPAVSPAVIAPTITPLADKNLDSDKDGLPDSIEKVLGTYITKADTDGDGYNDLQELKSGYSPLIAGAAGKYTPEEWDNVKGKIKIEDPEFYKREFETPELSPATSPILSLPRSSAPQASLAPSPSVTPN